MDPSLPKECFAGAASFQAWPALPGENQGCVSQLTQAEAGPGAKGYGPLLNPMLMSNCDCTRAPEPTLATCGPTSKGRAIG